MTTSTSDSLDVVETLWWLFALFGILTLGVGIFLIASPHETLRVFTVIAGIFLLVDGVIAIFRSILGESANRGLLALLGVLSAIAGLVLIKKPFETLVVFALIIGIWFIVVGVVRFVATFALPDGRGLNALVALIDVAAGIVILAWPELSLATLAVIFGIVLVVRGLLLTYVGFQLRHVAKDLGEAVA
jgi:uncharacterized membrane protein HdeD (DUF308 family)